MQQFSFNSITHMKSPISYYGGKATLAKRISDMGHYDGYTLEDFEALLKALETIEGKFMLSSYPSPILEAYTAKNGWKTHQYSMKVSVTGIGKKPKKDKIEVLTTNY